MKAPTQLFMAGGLRCCVAQVGNRCDACREQHSSDEGSFIVSSPKARGDLVIEELSADKAAQQTIK